MKFKKIHVTLKCFDPDGPGLLMNQCHVEDLGGQKLKPKSYSIEEDAEKSAYFAEIDGKRQLYIPSINIYAMILQTAGRRKISGYSAKGVLAGLMKIMPEKIPLGTDKYEVDVRHGRRPPKRGGRIPVARAHIRDWELNFIILYESETITNPYMIKEILDEAGIRMGLGDYRPQHEGPFGTFTVPRFEPEEEEL